MNSHWYAVAQLDSNENGMTYFNSDSLDEVLDFLTLTKGEDCQRYLWSAHTVDEMTARTINEYVSNHSDFRDVTYRGTLVDLLKVSIAEKNAQLAQLKRFSSLAARIRRSEES